MAGYLLSVGINRFKDSQAISELRYATRDAKRIFEFFLKNGFHCELLLNDEASESGIVRCLNVFLHRMKPGDRLVYFHSGHGVQTEDERQVVLGWDSDLYTVLHSPGMSTGGLLLSGLQGLTRKAGVARQLILDTCRNELERGKGGTSRSGYSEKDLNETCQAAAHNAPESPFAVYCSCRPWQKSYEIERLEAGLFSEALLWAMSDCVGRGRALAYDLELQQAVLSRVRELQAEHGLDRGASQEPWLQGAATGIPLAPIPGVAPFEVSISTPANQPVPSSPIFNQVEEVPREYSADGEILRITEGSFSSLGGLAKGSREAQDRQREYCGQHRLPLEVENELGMRFRLIPPGRFRMGSLSGEEGRCEDEGPQHQVEIGHPLWVGVFPVTQQEWEAVMGSNRSRFKEAGRNCPVENVSWDDCQAFLFRLSQKLNLEQGSYRLLSEAEWEYACRAGTLDPFCFGASLTSDLACFGSDRTKPVGSFPSNAWGLHDMHGNVWEWVEDDWHDSYRGSPANGSAWVDLTRSPLRVLRGGGWGYDASGCRSARRGWGGAGFRYSYFGGLRLARTLPVPH